MPPRFAEHNSQRRGTAAQRGYDRAWQRVRGAFLKAHPLCVECERRGKVRPAEVVHHLKPVEDFPELRLKWSNLEGLCRDCHERHHGRKAGGGGCDASGWPASSDHPWNLSEGGRGSKV
jgi:5-methylcytosine-specific restriction protein A